MPFEKFEDVQAIDNERRKAIAKSIRIISVEELKKLGEEIFDEPDRPWRQTFLLHFLRLFQQLLKVRIFQRIFLFWTDATRCRRRGFSLAGILITCCTINRHG